MHRALALKYRPQVFADLVGQEHVSVVLTRALERGRVAHAYLFAGARGVGKTTTARILAKALNCETRAGARDKGQPTGSEPCNACASCKEITTGISLDVAEIDGASNRGIADVQALREKVRFTPTGGRHRVVIIDEVHQLSNDAFAALLKTLEEPPPHLVFIFATTDPLKLPETIRSRTQRFDFARVPLRKVAARLTDIARREQEDPQGMRFELTEGAAILIAQKSEGSIRDAVSALDQVVSSGEAKVDEELVRRVLGIADHEAFFELVEGIVQRDAKQAMRALHAGFDKGLDPFELAQGLAEHIRHLLILKVDPGAAELVPATAEDVERLARQAETWSEHDLMRLMRLASDLSAPMKDSAQPFIHLEAAVLQMATLEPAETLAQLLERLEALERRLAGAPAHGAPGATGGAKVQGAGRVAESPPVRRPNHSGVPAAQAAPPYRMAPPSAPQGRPAGAPTAQVADAAVAVLDEHAPRLDEAIQRSWETVIEAVNAQKRMLGAFLQESRFMGVTKDALLLAMDDLHRTVVDERENRGLVEHHAEAVFGRRLVMCCRVGAEALAPTSQENVRPMVERAIAWFEGDIIDRPAGRNDG